MPYRLLLVEDEPTISIPLTIHLELEGFIVAVCENGKEAIKMLKQQPFDLIILDVMLPEIDGFDICNSIRLINQTLPILFLTAKDDLESKIKGLKVGADDYMTKPFSTEELVLRINNLLKRSSSQTNLSEVGSIIINQRQIYFDKFEIEHLPTKQISKMNKKEMLLLKLLVDNKNNVVPREVILDKVWGYEVFPTTRTVDNYIVSLRKLIEPENDVPQHILTIRGVGYKLVF